MHSANMHRGAKQYATMEMNTIRQDSGGSTCQLEHMHSGLKSTRILLIFKLQQHDTAVATTPAVLAHTLAVTTTHEVSTSRRTVKHTPAATRTSAALLHPHRR